MKICLCCGAQCAPDAPHCLACGEASFGAASPVLPPVLSEPADTEAPTDPAPDATEPVALEVKQDMADVIPDAPRGLIAPKRGPGRPRKDQGPN